MADSGESPRRRWSQMELGAKTGSAEPLWATHFPSLSFGFLIWKKRSKKILICWDEFLGGITFS